MVAVKGVRLPINNDKLQYTMMMIKLGKVLIAPQQSLKSTRQLKPEQLDQCE